MGEALAAALAVAAISGLLTGCARSVALRRGMLDVPNERSSHVVPTPRGGGIGIVVAATVALLGISVAWRTLSPLALTLLCGGAAVALIGFLDDRFGLAPGVRLLVHVIGALVAVLWLGPLPLFPFAGDAPWAVGLAALLTFLGIIWSLNLFNFMDGIDGIAGSEAVFVCCAGAALCFAVGIGPPVPLFSLMLGAAALGFLLWNWPPAKIFMGDVGSGYLGYAISVLAVAAGAEAPALLPVWLILGGVFFVDATVTLLQRLWRGERLQQAHRGHAYQRLSRHWKSHLRVTLAVLIVNVGWLLPCALAAAVYEELAWAILVLAWAPLVVGVIVTSKAVD